LDSAETPPPRGAAAPPSRDRRARAWRPVLLGLLLPVVTPSIGLSGSDAAAPERRGPSEIRDEHVFAQPRLTLPASAPWTAAAGRWTISSSALWSNCFSWNQDVPGEHPAHRSYLVDGETLSIDATVARGLRSNLEVAARLPIRFRGGGAMDGIIDAWHRAFGFPDGGRPYFQRDAFAVEGTTTSGGRFSWTDAAGGGLGALELSTRWRLLDGGRSAAALALVGRVALPTATGPFRGHGGAAGAQLVLAAPLARSLDFYAGVGATAQGRGPVGGVTYEPARAHGFAALEWRVGRRLSLVAETDAATRLVADVEFYPGQHWMLNVTGRLDLGRRVRLDLGFSENLKNQLSTTDFALFTAVALRP
jgi:hypothetical protein